MEHQEIINLYYNGLSIRQISLQAGFSASKTRKILIKNNIKLRSSRDGLCKRKENHILLNREILDIIEGELLGDGCLIKRTNQSKFSFQNSNEEYTQWLADLFISNGFKLTGKGVYKEIYYHKYWEKWYTRYCFSTICYIQLHELENKWYENRKKVVPENLEISPNIILHWYLGDGTLPNGNYAVFCTDSFSTKEVETLSQKMNEEMGIKSSTLKYKNNSRIFVPKTSIPKLLEYIGFSPIASMSYKWDLSVIGKINKKINITYSELLDFYIAKNLTKKEIANKYNCSKFTIGKKLQYFGIRKRKSNKIFNVCKEELQKLYIEENMTARQVAEFINCSYETIIINLRMFKIKKRNWRNKNED